MEFFYSITVRFKDCDMYGHVNHAVYLTYLECARVQLLIDIGMPLGDLIKSDHYFIIVGINIKYKIPAKMDENLTVLTKPLRITRIGGTFQQLIYRNDDLLASAEVKWACVNNKGKPVKLPPAFNKLKNNFVGK